MIEFYNIVFIVVAVTMVALMAWMVSGAIAIKRDEKEFRKRVKEKYNG